MKALRNHLERAREQYRSRRYPGDLSADVLGATPQRVLEYGTHRRIHRLWVGGAVAATAAAIALVFFGIRSVNRPVELAQPILHAQYDQDELSLGLIPVVSTVDSIPQDFQMAPPQQSLSFSMPSFSYSDDQQQPPAEDAPRSPQSSNTRAFSIEEAIL